MSGGLKSGLESQTTLPFFGDDLDGLGVVCSLKGTDHPDHQDPRWSADHKQTTADHLEQHPVSDQISMLQGAVSHLWQTYLREIHQAASTVLQSPPGSGRVLEQRLRLTARRIAQLTGELVRRRAA